MLGGVMYGQTVGESRHGISLRHTMIRWSSSEDKEKNQAKYCVIAVLYYYDELISTVIVLYEYSTKRPKPEQASFENAFPFPKPRPTA